MKGVRTSTIQPYKIIVRCEQRDGPPRPSAHHVTGRLKKKKKIKILLTCIKRLLALKTFLGTCLRQVLPYQYLSSKFKFLKTKSYYFSKFIQVNDF